MDSFPFLQPADKSIAKKVRVILLAAVTVVLLSAHLFACIVAVRDGYYPTSSDEIDYVKSVEYFVLNGKPHAFATFDETYSANGNFSFHGPMYSVIFGLPQLIFGFYSSKFILYLNIFFSVVSISWLYRIQNNIESRFLSISILISSPVFFVYSTSYMVEAFQILVSIAFAGLFSVMLANWALGSVLPLLLGFTRQSNFLYSVAIFTGRTSAKRLAILAFFWVVMLIVLLLEIHFLHAPYPGGKLSALTQALVRFDVLGAIHQLASNISQGVVQFFTWSEDGSFYLVAKYTFFLATVYSVVSGAVRRERALMAAGLTGLAFFAALISLYDVHGWRDLRSLAGVTIFLVAILCRYRSRIVLYSTLLAQLAVFPALANYRTEFTKQRVLPFGTQMMTDSGRISAYEMLSKLTATHESRFILVAIEAGLFSTDMSVEYLSLPVRSDSGVAIRYTFKRNGVAGASMADYQLSSRPCPNSRAVLTTSYFHACRVRDQ